MYLHNEHYHPETIKVCVCVCVCVLHNAQTDWCPVLLRRPRNRAAGLLKSLCLKPLIRGFPTSSLKSPSVCPGLKGWADTLPSPHTSLCLLWGGWEGETSFVGWEAAHSSRAGEGRVRDGGRFCGGGGGGGVEETWLLMKKMPFFFFFFFTRRYLSPQALERRVDTHAGEIMSVLFQMGADSRSLERSRVRSSCLFDPSQLQLFLCVWSRSFIFLLSFTTPCYFMTSLFPRCREGWQAGLSWWGNALPQTYVFLQITSLALFCQRVQPFSSTFNLFFFFSPSPPHFSPVFNPSLLPLQGGRQVTAVGGRRACHVLLCLGLHRNIPPQVTPATAFPF